MLLLYYESTCFSLILNTPHCLKYSRLRLSGQWQTRVFTISREANTVMWNLFYRTNTFPNFPWSFFRWFFHQSNQWSATLQHCVHQELLCIHEKPHRTLQI